MTIKLVATDLDGTLLNGAGEITPQVQAMVRRMLDAGVILAIATGRMHASALQVGAELQLDVPIISYNGALVKRALSDEVLQDLRLSVAASEQILAIAEHFDLVTHIYSGDRLYVKEANPFSDHYVEKTKVRYHLAPDLHLLLQENGEPTKILLWCEPERMAEVRAYAQQKLGDSVFITQSTAYFLEFLHKDGGKGSGVRLLAAMYGITQAEILGIGDNLNDLPLLEAAGYKVAMGNAVDELKAQATFVTTGNDENGWCNAMEKLIFA